MQPALINQNFILTKEGGTATIMINVEATKGKMKLTISAGYRLLAAVCILVLLAAAPQSAAARRSDPTSIIGRQGGWLDSILFSVTAPGNAVAGLQADQIDLYMTGLNPAVYAPPDGISNLNYSLANGLYFDITFNPAGPVFTGTGKLNPFASAPIREAMNRLVDREYIAAHFFANTASPKLLPLEEGYADYIRYADQINALESAYTYNFSAAAAAISAEMLNLGAIKSSDLWYYNGELVTLIFIIRSDGDGTRRLIGDYVADQLELLGFTVDRQYKTSSQASPIWMGSNPADGLWHLYTGGWASSEIIRDLGDNFLFFASPNSSMNYSPLWQAYMPSAEFADVMQQLATKTYTDMAARDALFGQALPLSLNDDNAGSLHLWLLEAKNFNPRQADVLTSYDLAGGVGGSRLWPYVTRFDSVEGGQLRVGMEALLAAPWNPVAGSTWLYDQTVIHATQDYGLIVDPFTGLVWPQRAESAAVTAVTGLPVTQTLDWVTLNFAPQIDVPADAWVDWNAATQTFITRETAYPGGLTAQIKSTITYPENLFSAVIWQDGSHLSLGDFILKMILTFDRGNPESIIYDESALAALENFMTTFKGVRIVSTSPLIIETYSDSIKLDAELNVVDWWPNYATGPGPWHTVALGVRTEADGDLAFSMDKAASLAIPQADYKDTFYANPLYAALDASVNDDYIPYINTMGQYVSQAEASARWVNLDDWVTNQQGHFWLGSGPYILDDISVDTITLIHFEAFPDAAGRWDAYNGFPWGVVSQIPLTEVTTLGTLYTTTGGSQWQTSTNWLISIRPDNWFGANATSGHLENLNLNANQLDGYLPTELGNLAGLKSLDLAHNQLRGHVPASFASLSSLEYLDLDYNYLIVPADYPNPANPLHVFLQALDPDWHLRQTPLNYVYLPTVLR
jgi:peptide/nickel transport system substrate-binding protein